MAALLTALICASEKSANIARACKREDTLFQLLIEEKKGPEKNKKFVQDFKTLADVIIQEVIKHDIGKKFPELASHIAGEESNHFENGLGETIIVKVCKTEQATAELISKVLDGNLKAAGLLAKCIHEDVHIDGPDLEKLNIDIPMDTIGIWVDPIDSTNQYIKGQLEEKFKSGIHPYGLKSAAVLIGVFDRNSGQPIMGVINVPFNEADPNLRWQGKYYWGISYNDINVHSIPKQLPAHHNQLSIVMSSSEKDCIKKALAPICGERMFYASGAGYKILCTILGLADAYVITADTTFKWDTCAPHAILKSLGGGIVNLAKVLAEVKEKGPGVIPEVQYKMPDEGSKETEKWANTGGLVAYRSQQQLEAIINALLV
ncbi:inositol polyphosphate 1-phosphatase [Pristis pectinata]|uniref:inositol polyphosphate 1-phosphatase n=1 Tax=Pristis pectinata TaxID=685728 RepID=UPI00223E73C1|nr:inositol polyphosphate 1-phosphatase [Pristis pectinata]XP_051865641.1 inositol polyphosphate 1-phosphatase [Pristis pectinata]XP_051865642.1 inositol polyphosphate 1-phosphatase [Pristis pectinata]XP_051865644.1 inositol polyphosphate 1-phosphatase [Pristis pectinata]